MKKLQVINNNGQLLVDSREVAGMVARAHDQLMRSIRTYIEYLTSAKMQTSEFFMEGSYEDGKGETRPCYFLTRKGCDLVANKLTGEKGVLFTAAYVTTFEEMENEIKQPKHLSEKEQLKASMKLSLITSEEVENLKIEVGGVKERVETLVNTMRIDGVQEFQLRSQGQKKVLEVLGGIKSPAYVAVGRRAFAELWRGFKQHFNLPRYSELQKSRFDEGVYFISKWRPSTSLEIEIEQHNRQTQLKLVKAE